MKDGVGHVNMHHVLSQKHLCMFHHDAEFTDYDSEVVLWTNPDKHREIVGLQLPPCVTVYKHQKKCKKSCKVCVAFPANPDHRKKSMLLLLHPPTLPLTGAADLYKHKFVYRNTRTCFIRCRNAFEAHDSTLCSLSVSWSSI